MIGLWISNLCASLEYNSTAVARSFSQSASKCGLRTFDCKSFALGSAQPINRIDSISASV